MISAWLIMLFAGNLGHQVNNPKFFVSYFFCLPLGLLVDAVTIKVINVGGKK